MTVWSLLVAFRRVKYEKANCIFKTVVLSRIVEGWQAEVGLDFTPFPIKRNTKGYRKMVVCMDEDEWIGWKRLVQWGLGRVGLQHGIDMDILTDGTLRHQISIQQGKWNKGNPVYDVVQLR
jgi:hypothetical protein